MNEIRHFFIFSLFIFSISPLLGQNGSLGGRLIDDQNGEALIGATILIEGTNRGTTSNVEGKFIIEQLDPGRYTLNISFIGLENQSVRDLEIKSGERLELGDIRLMSSSISLKELVVTPGQYSIMGNAPLSRQTLGSKELKNMSFAEDITRAVTRLPGVASNDFSSKFTIRGGESDEVLMILDGMELYEPFHQRDFSGGLFSLVDIETIEGIDLVTGGFSSEYGNRQSGVFNMRTKTPFAGQRTTSMGISVMNARFYTDGTSPDGRTSYLFSARRGMLDQSFRIIGETETTPNFYDAMGKIQFKFNDRHTISFHTIHGGDKTAVRDVAPEAHDIHDTQYFNTHSWLSWKASFHPKVFARTLLYGGIISQERNGDTAKDEYSDKLNFDLNDNRDYHFVGVKQDWNLDISKNFILKTGFDVRQLNATYDYQYSLQDIRIDPFDSLVHFRDSADIETQPSGQLTALYLSAKYRLLPDLFLETGLRHDYSSYSHDNLLSPRVGFTYAFSPRSFLRGAWGYYYQIQFINNLDVNHSNTEFNPAELSTHYVLGFEHLFANGISFRLEGYYKDISRLSDNYQNLRDPWEVFPESRNDVVRLDYSGASAKGIELFLKYDKGGKVSWWFSYALADASETITELEFEGLVTPQLGTLARINNQKHTIYTDINYRPTDKWSFNLSWQFYTGLPNTIYDYQIQEATGLPLTELPLHFYPVHLTFRGEKYPAYHRMDLRTNKVFDLKRGKVLAFIHLVNVYNRENMRKFDLDARNDQDELSIDENGNYIPFRDDATWFGFLPAFGVVWEFSNQ